MFGKILGGIVGAKAADHLRGVTGAGGAVLGAAAPVLLRRLGPLGLVAALAGGYAVKRYQDKRGKRPAARPKVKPSAT